MQTDVPAEVPLSDGLGAADPERAAFDSWCMARGCPADALQPLADGSYCTTGTLAGMWSAWQAASAVQRAGTADLCGNLAAISWAEWDERADPVDQGKALALEHLAALLAEPNAELSR